MRKVIQIQALSRGAEGARSDEICALCDDGSVWLHDTTEQGVWRGLPGIPSDERPASEKPLQAGKRWLSEDDAQLADLWCQQRFDAARIADLMQRSDGAIISRLVHLDFFDERDDARAESNRRQAEAQMA